MPNGGRWQVCKVIALTTKRASQSNPPHPAPLSTVSASLVTDELAYQSVFRNFDTVMGDIVTL